MNLTVNTNSASFADLRNSGFTICKAQSLTVTPFVLNTVFNFASATSEVIINYPGKYEYAMLRLL